MNPIARELLVVLLITFGWCWCCAVARGYR